MKKCHVCGVSDPARSHLFPRALLHDIRAGDKHAFRIQLDNPQPKASQSGDWRDDILCRAHEASLNDADTYGIRFCRSFADAAELFRKGVARTPNPQPQLLTKFVHAVVWRHTAALIARGKSHWLGPYHQRIQDVVFGHALPLEGAILEPGHAINGERAIIAVNPHPAEMLGFRAVRFDIGGLSFYLKTSNQPFSKAWPFSLDLDPILVPLCEPNEITANPSLRAIVDAADRAGRL